MIVVSEEEIARESGLSKQSGVVVYACCVCKKKTMGYLYKGVG